MSCGQGTWGGPLISHNPPMFGYLPISDIPQMSNNPQMHNNQKMLNDSPMPDFRPRHGYPPTHSYTPTHGYPPTHSYYPVHGYPPTYGYPPTFHVPQLPSYPLPYGYPCGEPHNHPSPSVKRRAHINYPLALVHQTWLAGDPDPMLISEIHLFLKAPRLNIRALTLAISHLPRFQQTIQLNHIFSPLQYTSRGSQEEYTVTSHRNDGDRRSRKRNHNRSDGSHRYTQEYSKPIVH